MTHIHPYPVKSSVNPGNFKAQSEPNNLRSSACRQHGRVPAVLYNLNRDHQTLILQLALRSPPLCPRPSSAGRLRSAWTLQSAPRTLDPRGRRCINPRRLVQRGAKPAASPGWCPHRCRVAGNCATSPVWLQMISAVLEGLV